MGASIEEALSSPLFSLAEPLVQLQTLGFPGQAGVAHAAAGQTVAQAAGRLRRHFATNVALSSKVPTYFFPAWERTCTRGTRGCTGCMIEVSETSQLLVSSYDFSIAGQTVDHAYAELPAFHCTPVMVADADRKLAVTAPFHNSGSRL